MPNKKTGNPIAKTIGCSRFVFNHFFEAIHADIVFEELENDVNGFMLRIVSR
ncbi:helix-turn-helix domain-containing protein [Weizmannia sp. FSL W8-0401]|uniref:helix-turn-helix domain-containing protein n=1 Tax=unclassified Heyndrickxia TaxID=2837518 RepID=UPI0040484D15